MKTAVFSAKPYDEDSLGRANEAHELLFLAPRLDERTAPLADGYPAVCAFVNDDLSAPLLRRLHQGGTRLIALRSAGFNHVDLEEAARLELAVTRVPAYSPYAVAEHALGLMLALDRRIHRAYNRVRDGNFSLDGLLGFDLHGKTVGIIGTGTIGVVFARLLRGFHCRMLGFDPCPATRPAACASSTSRLRRSFAKPTSSPCSHRSHRRRTTSSTPKRSAS